MTGYEELRESAARIDMSRYGENQRDRGGSGALNERDGDE